MKLLFDASKGVVVTCWFVKETPASVDAPQVVKRRAFSRRVAPVLIADVNATVGGDGDEGEELVGRCRVVVHPRDPLHREATAVVVDPYDLDVGVAGVVVGVVDINLIGAAIDRHPKVVV